MSPDKLRKRKLKERSRVDREINELKSQEKKKKTKLDLNKERKRDKENGVGSDYPPSLEDDYRVVEKNHEIFNGERGESTEKKKKKKKKKSMLVLNTKNRKKTVEVDSNNDDRVHAEENADDGMMYPDDRAKISTISQTLSATSEEPKESNSGTKIKSKKGKKEKKHKRKETHISTGRIKEETPGGVDEPKVDEISSVDEDCSRGMKKWLITYKESRPGLNVLQQRIDDYITAYEEQQEEERKEREARAAEGGWTVVVHHKGRKKTTDTESGVIVGSVAQEAVVDKMGKKKNKEIPLDFYRFHKREARRNEVMMLQSKFEQDKKRIQQLRAARKFRPY